MIYIPAEDSVLLEEQVKKFAKGKIVLDMGTGSGILAIAAKKSKAKKVIAADINESVRHILNNQKIKFIHSDLFSKIVGEFDLIIFNPPYLPDDDLEDVESKTVTTGGKEGDELILRFLAGSKVHLSKKGTILLLISTLTPKENIKKLLKSLNYEYEIVSEKKLFMETLEVWKIRNKKV